MKKQFIVLIFLSVIFQVSFGIEKNPNTLIGSSKIFIDNIVDGAYETWDDLKEVYDEVSLDVSEKFNENYKKVVGYFAIKQFFSEQMEKAQDGFYKVLERLRIL